tara:strand:+ start:613 stop:2232 length:1620 start_codon:yes stop_codon:yes gene_type:complete
MATFKVQVEDITGSVGDDTALSSWLQDGAKEVINFVPQQRLEQVASTSVFENTIDVEGKKVLGVLRKDANNSSFLTPCVKVAPTKKGVVQDSSNMEYATTGDPVYWFDGDTLQVFPTSASSNDMSLVHISFDFSAVTYDDSSITNFPDEAEPAVVLYATRNALQRLMTDIISNDAIDHASTGALALMNAEIDDVVHDTTGSLKLAKDQITAFVTSIGDIDDTTELWDNTNKRFTVIRDALLQAQNLIDGDAPHANYDAEANLSDIDAALTKIDAHLVDGEAILTNDPTSGDISAALVLIKAAVDQAATAAGKFLTVDSDSIFGDESTFLTNDSQLTRVKTALDSAHDLINNNQPSATTDVYGAQANEDVELVTSALNIVQIELARAQAHLTEWTSIGDMRTKEVQVALSEADGYAKEVQARLTYATSYIAAGNARGQEGSARLAQLNGTLSVVSQELARANVAIAEVNTIMASYRLELEGVAPYLQEVQARLASSAAYGQEAQARIARDQEKYTWYEKQYAMVDARYKEFIQSLKGGTK